MSAAVKQADVRVDGVSASEVEELIRLLCTTQDADEAAAQIVALGVGRSPDVQDVVEGVGRGAEGFCPAVAGEEPTLLNDVYNGALKLIAETSTTASG